MAESAVFQWVSARLELRTSLSRIEARGTVRLVLKDAGLEASNVTATQMEVVLRKLMVSALSKRRVEDSEHVCARLVAELAQAEFDDNGTESAYDVFSRFDGSKR